MKRAIYPGSFDPITFGHIDIIERASKVFDEIIVLILNNSKKNALFSADERVSMIKELLKDYDNIVVDTNDSLLVDYARRKNVPIIIRGLRAITDFEYEIQIAQTNHVQYNELETVFFTTSLNYSYLSSTIVREFASYGGDISRFVPESIIPLIMEKYGKGE